MKAFNKIVVKVGTSTLTQGAKALSRGYMLDLARQLDELGRQGKEVILVSSGAIAAGRELMKHPQVERSLPAKQMFAAVGQVELMHIWTELFLKFNRHVGQILLTKDDFNHRKRYLNARDTLSCLLSHQIIPIINENDSVATKEIRVGDNDNLAALVANLIGADLLILLTDQQGLYTADPRHDPNAKHIPVVEKIDESIFALARGASSGLGTGGMTTKIEAAEIASHGGTRTVIAPASHPDVVLEVCGGKHVGTLFMTELTPKESRKRWMLSEKRQGSIHVDEGAASKILHGGASLLASGITHTDHTFDRGAIVAILDPQGQQIAVGISNYGNQEIQKLIGVHSKHIEDILGYSYGSEVVHRSNMTRLMSSKETE